MSRRIAIAILLTVWATLVGGGVVVYVTVKTLLLAEMDDRLYEAARNLPVVRGSRSPVPATEARWYVVHEAKPRRVGAPMAQAAAAADALADPGPVGLVEDRRWAELAAGRRYRVLEIRFDRVPGAAADGTADGRGHTPGGGLLLMYGEPSDRVDRILRRLRVSMLVLGAAAGAAAALVAVGVARAALRPLRDTAAVVGAIDEQNLGRRIDAAALPAELRPTAERLNAMLERLQGAFEQRRRFLADAAHELRTPVAALVSVLELALRRPRGPDELKEALQTSLTDARLLHRLVNVLLEHARGEVSRSAPEPVDAAALLNECADVVEPLAARRGITLVRRIEPGVELVAEPRRVTGIVVNLLSNAVEYNHPGGEVELSARLVSDGGRNGDNGAHGDNGDAVAAEQLLLAVRDTGPGIAAEHLPELFQPFYRAGHTEAGQEGQHLGLGLFIVQSHVRAMGGTCRVDSTVGVGTTFHITLPGARRASGSGDAATGTPAAARNAPAPGRDALVPSPAPGTPRED